MGLPVARLGDSWSGICSASGHGSVTGTIVSGSALTLDESKQLARVGDQVIASCGHTGQIITGSALTLDESKQVARIGDRIGGSTLFGQIITGSSLTTSD